MGFSSFRLGDRFNVWVWVDQRKRPTGAGVTFHSAVTSRDVSGPGVGFRVSNSRLFLKLLQQFEVRGLGVVVNPTP